MYIRKLTDHKGVVHTAHSSEEFNVFDMLIERDIDFESEKTFSDLKGDKDFLRFDCFVHGKNRDFLIEVDGTQHRKKKRFTTENLLRYDKMKDEYCERKGIKLYRIVYFSGGQKYVRSQMRYILKSEGLMGV